MHLRSLVAAAYRTGGGIDTAHCLYAPAGEAVGSAGVSMPYYRLLAGLARLTQPRLIVEIGTFFGGSTLAFAAGLDGEARILTVDPVRHPNPGLDADPRIERLTASALDADGMAQIAAAIGDRRIDILYVDALKDGDFVLDTLAAFAPFRPRLIVLDDIVANESIEAGWDRLVARYPDRTLAVCDLLEGVRNIEFDMGVILADDGLADDLAETVARVNRQGAWDDVRVGPPYDYTLAEAHPGIHTMMSQPETGMLHRLVMERYQGIGQIVDAGTFLGGSTIAFTDALAALGRPKSQRVHAYDRFTNSMAFFDKFFDPPIPRYGSFLHVTLANIGAGIDRVNVHPGNFTRQRWNGAPIELLFVDIAKSPQLNAHVYSEFMPSCIPGHTVYIQQDFVHVMAPWIQYGVAYLMDHFEILGTQTPSLYLGVVSQPDDDKVRRLVADDFSPFEKAELVETMADRFDDHEAKRTMQLIAARLWRDAGAHVRFGELLELCEMDPHYGGISRGAYHIRVMRKALGMDPNPPRKPPKPKPAA